MFSSLPGACEFRRWTFGKPSEARRWCRSGGSCLPGLRRTILRRERRRFHSRRRAPGTRGGGGHGDDRLRPEVPEHRRLQEQMKGGRVMSERGRRSCARDRRSPRDGRGSSRRGRPAPRQRAAARGDRRRSRHRGGAATLLRPRLRGSGPRPRGRGAACEARDPRPPGVLRGGDPEEGGHARLQPRAGSVRQHLRERAHPCRPRAREAGPESPRRSSPRLVRAGRRSASFVPLTG